MLSKTRRLRPALAAIALVICLLASYPSVYKFAFQKSQTPDDCIQRGSNSFTEATHAHHYNNGTVAHSSNPLSIDGGDEAKGVTPRAFPIFAEPFPCLEPEDGWGRSSVLRSPASEGFFFIKEMKTGSSTLSGVAIRISMNMANRLGTKYNICKSRFDHVYAYQMEFGRRDRKKSFLWTVVRDPNRRAASQFFHFQVSRQKVEPSDENFQKYLSGMELTNHYFQTLSMEDYNGTHKEAEMVELTNKVLNDFDFIGVTERMDESLVVLSMLLNLELEDILYLSSKQHGSFDDAGQKECNYIVPTYISPGMKTFFADSQMWKTQSSGDAMLHRAAWHSLDATIDNTLGRDKVNARLEEFQRMKQKVEESCLKSVLFPCDAGGRRNKPNSCLWQDSGCGNACIDSVVASQQFIK